MATGRRLGRMLAAAIMCGLFFGCSSSTTTDNGTGGTGGNTRVLTGFVYSTTGTSTPIVGAHVSAAGLTVVTNSAGMYTLRNLPTVGTLTVVVTATGYDSASSFVSDAHQANLDFHLSPSGGGGITPEGPPSPPVFS